MLCLGRVPFVDDPRDLHLASYVDLSTIHLPDPLSGEGPFDHTAWLGNREWGALGNLEVGDCGLAAPAHETMALAAVATGTPAPFTTASVLSDYECFGYRPAAGPPGNNPTDQGVEVRAVYRFRRKWGIVDGAHKRHRIGHYLRVDWRVPELVYVAKRLFGSVNYGFNLPQSAMDQFNQGEPWSVVSGSEIAGGHDVCDLAEPSKMISWGSVVEVEPAFVQAYAEECWTAVSREILNDHGLSPEGFDIERLEADYRAIGGR